MCKVSKDLLNIRLTNFSVDNDDQDNDFNTKISSQISEKKTKPESNTKRQTEYLRTEIVVKDWNDLLKEEQVLSEIEEIMKNRREFIKQRREHLEKVKEVIDSKLEGVSMEDIIAYVSLSNK